MRIGYIAKNFPALSETFIPRGAKGLCKEGYRSALHGGSAGIAVREGIEHLHGSPAATACVEDGTRKARPASRELLLRSHLDRRREASLKAIFAGNAVDLTRGSNRMEE